jgi:hypothetical protein
LLGHKAREGDDVETSQSGGVSLVVLDGTPESCGLSEGAFDRPTSGREHEAALCFGRFDDFESDTLLLGGFSGLLAGIALIDVGERNALASRLLDGLGEAADFGAVVNIARCDVQGQEMAERIGRQMQLGAALALGAVVARARFAFGGRMVAAVGSSLRPEAWRSNTRKSYTKLQNSPPPTNAAIADKPQPRAPCRWDRPPGDAVADHAAQAILQLAQRMLALARVLKGITSKEKRRCSRAERRAHFGHRVPRRCQHSGHYCRRRNWCEAAALVQRDLRALPVLRL